jgi:hypothetical protein
VKYDVTDQFMALMHEDAESRPVEETEMPEIKVSLTLADADHLLAACECVLNQDDSGKAALGVGLQPYALEEAARKIEAVADLARQGIVDDR